MSKISRFSLPFLAFLALPALGGGTMAVDLLTPADPGFAGIPSNYRCVDIYVDLGNNAVDEWRVGGIQAMTADLGVAGPSGDGEFVYFDSDANTPGHQLGLVNPGFESRFTTSLSKPYRRNNASRFENAGVVAPHGYQPPTPFFVANPHELNVGYWDYAPVNVPGPDGYVARLAIDIAAIEAPGIDLADYDNWGVCAIAQIPPAAHLVLVSQPPTGTLFPATMFMSMEHWQFPTQGINWALWYVPEPATGFCLAIVSLILSQRWRR